MSLCLVLKVSAWIAVGSEKLITLEWTCTSQLKSIILTSQVVTHVSFFILILNVFCSPSTEWQKLSIWGFYASKKNSFLIWYLLLSFWSILGKNVCISNYSCITRTLLLVLRLKWNLSLKKKKKKDCQNISFRCIVSGYFCFQIYLTKKNPKQFFTHLILLLLTLGETKKSKIKW